MKKRSILFDSDIQRHLLEVANIRMLFMVGVRDAQVREFQWTTCKLKKDEVKRLDAKATFRCGDSPHRVGIMNHPTISESLIPSIESALQDTGVEKILIVSRDDAHQVQLQKFLAGASSMVRTDVCSQRTTNFTARVSLFPTGNHVRQFLPQPFDHPQSSMPKTGPTQ